MPSPAPHTLAPALVLDLDVARQQYQELATAFDGAHIWFATKCNPHPALLTALAGAGCGFEVASVHELDLVAATGVPLSQVPFTNPIRTTAQTLAGMARGVRMWTVDSPRAIHDIADQAARAGVDVAQLQVSVRLDVPGDHATHNLRGRFGVTVDELEPLTATAATRGLNLTGLAFHVGSQTRDPHAWEVALSVAARAATALRHAGHEPQLLDVGGGFPAAYSRGRLPMSRYADVIHAGAARPELTGLQLAIEPGRSIAAAAGTLHTRVVADATRSGRRCVHVDVGVYTGLMEALWMRPSEQFPLTYAAAGRPTTAATIVGPTCDGVDVVADDALLPADLAEGEVLQVGEVGAYSYSVTTRFNGFTAPPVWVKEGSVLVRAR